MFKLAPFTKEDYFFGKVPKDLVTDFIPAVGLQFTKRLGFFFSVGKNTVGHL
jgi:hypothetical protein